MRLALLCIMAVLTLGAFANAGSVENGEKLFKRKCKSCHRLTEGTKVGPSLMGVTKRRSREWLHKWLQNPKAMIESGDAIAVKLKKKYKKLMPKIKQMKNEKDRNDILSFLESMDNKE